MIHALIVPILNGPEHLSAMLNSIDHPVEQVVIIDNGGVVNWRPAMTVSHDHIGDCAVIQLPSNIGVASSWNLGLQVAPRAAWWLIVNHDIQFASGDLAKIDAAVQPDEAGIWQAEGFSAFAITPSAIERIGMFDTNFVNGYFEDDDYGYRAGLAGVPIHKVETGIVHRGSSTIYDDPFYMEQNHISFRANDAYYRAKWGGGTHGGEAFTSPFDAGGDLRDLRPSPARTRAYAWRRR